MRDSMKTFCRLTLALYITFTITPCYADSDKADSIEAQLVGAAEHGQLAEVKKLLSNGANVNGKYYSSTALNSAIIKKNADLVALLLKQGADPNLADATSTPLIKAVTYFGNPNIVDLLLKNGADPNLAFGNEKEKEGPLGYLSKTVRSSESDQIEDLNLLVHAGARVDATSADGRTPLHNAILLNKVDLVRALLKFGANPNQIMQADIPDFSTGETPLQTAVANYGNSRDISIVKLLLDFGANPNYHNNRLFQEDIHASQYDSWNGVTPLIIAAQMGYNPIVSFLLSRGADPCINRTDGISPREAAINSKHVETARIITEYLKKHPCQVSSGATYLNAKM